MKYAMFLLMALIGMGIKPAHLDGHSTTPERVEFIKETQEKEKEAETISNHELFERTVDIIKKYESLHEAKHWPYVGYGHRVRPGEGFVRGKALSEKEADRLLRRDLREYVKMYSEFGQDACLLAALAYNCGQGRVNSSSIVKKLRAGNRDIRQAYLAHSRAKGKTLRILRERREAELEALFIP